MSIATKAVVIGAGALFLANAFSGAKPTQATVPDKPLLHLNSFSCSHEYGYTTTEGSVTNTSSERLSNLMVVGTHYADDGTFIKSDQAMVEYNPLMPGQTSPFRTMSTYNPMMTKCDVGFKTMFGGAVAESR